MGVSNAPTAKGKEAARDLRHSTAREELKVEAAKGSDLEEGRGPLRGALEKLRRKKRRRQAALIRRPFNWKSVRAGAAVWSQPSARPIGRG